MMQKRLFILLPVSFAIILSLTGCATPGGRTSSQAENSTTLAVTADLRFKDLPVPAGFKLDKEQSFVFQTDELRVALLKYTGRAKQQDLVEFFKARMADYNWNLLNVVEYNRIVLNFNRSDQTCIVTIEPRGAKKSVTISVAPKASPSRRIDKE